MEYYLKIKPERNIGTYSLHSFNKFSDTQKKKIISVEYITLDKYGIPYKHGGYVKCDYGLNKKRYSIYENIPQFGNCLATFDTLEHAIEFINKIGAE
jgi:hypothetical protein